MRKTINRVDLAGVVYNQNLKIKKVEKKESAYFGQEFITGTVDIATDPECLNIVTVNYGFVTPKTKDSKENMTYTHLKKVMDTNATILNVGMDEAIRCTASPSIENNDFYVERNGEVIFVTSQRLGGGFFTIVKTLPDLDAKKNKFKLDFLITKTDHKEITNDDDEVTDEYTVIKGYGFDYRGAILPLEFHCRNTDGMKYFESLECDSSKGDVLFTQVSGKIISTTIKTSYIEKSAFGAGEVQESERKFKEWLVDWASPTPYEFGDEEVLTVAEIKEKQTAYETNKASLRKRYDETQAAKENSSNAFSATANTVSTGGFAGF